MARGARKAGAVESLDQRFCVRYLVIALQVMLERDVEGSGWSDRAVVPSCSTTNAVIALHDTTCLDYLFTPGVLDKFYSKGDWVGNSG